MSGLWRLASRAFGPRKHVVGKDAQGNVYYWVKDRWSPVDGGVRRMVEYVEDDYYEAMTRLPGEWQAWLQFRREEPPTQAEQDMIELRKQRVAELVAEREAEEAKARLRRRTRDDPGEEAVGAGAAPAEGAADAAQRAARFLPGILGPGASVAASAAAASPATPSAPSAGALGANDERTPAPGSGAGDSYQPGLWSPGGAKARDPE